MTLSPQDKNLVAELVAAAKPSEPRLRGCLVCGFPTRDVVCVAHADLILQDPTSLALSQGTTERRHQ